MKTITTVYCGRGVGDVRPARSASTLARRDGVLELFPTRLLTERLGTTPSSRTHPTQGNVMKGIFTRAHRALWGIAMGAFLIGHSAPAAEMTAFELAKEGNRYVGEQSKDKVVQIRSEKSVASMIPDIWYVVYY